MPALTILNTRSQNFYGEQILRTVGRERDGEGSIEQGIASTPAVLEKDLGVAPPTALLDGSGLSYGNKATATQIAALLRAMHRRPDGAAYTATLKEKWSGKIRCRVKTGSLAITRCLAGYIPKGDRTWIFVNATASRRRWLTPILVPAANATAVAIVLAASTRIDSAPWDPRVAPLALRGASVARNVSECRRPLGPPRSSAPRSSAPRPCRRGRVRAPGR